MKSFNGSLRVELGDEVVEPRAAPGPPPNPTPSARTNEKR